MNTDKVKEEYILGIHSGHDATAVLMKNGQILEAMSEERLSRCKKHVGFPHLSVAYIKEKYRIENFAEVVVVGATFEPYFFTTLEDNKNARSSAPVVPKDYLRSLGVTFSLVGRLLAIRDYLLLLKVRRNAKERVQGYISDLFPGATITYIDHHTAHAWATVPFLSDLQKKHLILTLDGAGDGLSGSISIYEAGKMTRQSAIPVSASLGLLYSAVVDLLGMKRNEHEFKVMGLAPYAKASAGEKVYELLKKWVWFDEESMTIQSSIPLERATSHLIAHSFYQYRFDSLAYGIQKLAEEIMKKMVSASVRKYDCGSVAVGGGVFMNVKANQYIRALPEVKEFVVAPSGGDESLAIGAAVSRYCELHDEDVSQLHKLSNLYLGSDYTESQITEAIAAEPELSVCEVTKFSNDENRSIESAVAELLAKNSVVGRFSGRSEWGARALGNRSILANPTSRDNVKLINEMIKGRDFWMPFATSMLYERRNDYLVDADTYKAPFMAITFETKEKAHTELIAALHPYDLTSRPQMVEKEVNPQYHKLITEFQQMTGSGGILNTSFNLHGEPNVETPQDAIRTFLLSGLPHLALGNFLISKK